MPNYVKRHVNLLKKIFKRNKKKSKDENIQKWRDLSPSRPPLPFLLPESFRLNNDTNHSDASEPKLSENTPSTSIYIPHNSHSSRQLHIIYEESEPESQTNSTPSNSNETIQVTPPSLPSPSIISEPQQGDQGELKSKQILFCQMVQDAYDYGVMYEHPKVFELLFDQNDNISGVQIILKNGRKMKYLGFEGHPQYIAPEFFVNTTYNHEMADVWALGVTLYQLLINKSPFSEFDNHRQLFQHMMIPDLAIPNDLAEDAKDLIQKMLAPEISRASLETVMFHPWLKNYKFKRRHPPKTKKKFCRVIRHILRFIFKGPFPPPSSQPKKYI